jgi:uncharacterized protein (TIGR02145 family)
VSGCTSSSIAGTMTVVSSLDATSTKTWTIGAQTWSAPLVKAQTGCVQTTDFGTSTTPPTLVAYYRSSGLYSGSGYLYNWICVIGYGYLLCPSPWRVPTTADFVTLDIALGGSGSLRNDEDPNWINSNYIVKWGGAYGGYGFSTDVSGAGAEARYHSATQSGNVANGLTVTTAGRVYPTATHWRSSMGLQVRCVK